MKRIKMIFGLLVIAALLVLPMKASAAEKVEFDNATAACTTPDDDGYCETTLVLKYQKGSEDQTNIQFGGKISLIDERAATGIKDFAITSLDSTKYEVRYTGDILKGTGAIVIIVKDSSSLSATKTTPIAKITYKHSQELVRDGIDCSIQLNLGNKGDYIKPEPTPSSPKTGANLPYIILGVVGVGALAIYATTNKKSKLHDI